MNVIKNTFKKKKTFTIHSTQPTRKALQLLGMKKTLEK